MLRWPSQNISLNYILSLYKTYRSNKIDRNTRGRKLKDAQEYGFPHTQRQIQKILKFFTSGSFVSSLLFESDFLSSDLICSPMWIFLLILKALLTFYKKKFFFKSPISHHIMRSPPRIYSLNPTAGKGEYVIAGPLTIPHGTLSPAVYCSVSLLSEHSSAVVQASSSLHPPDFPERNFWSLSLSLYWFVVTHTHISYPDWNCWAFLSLLHTPAQWKILIFRSSAIQTHVRK